MQAHASPPLNLSPLRHAVNEITTDPGPEQLHPQLDHAPKRPNQLNPSASKQSSKEYAEDPDFIRQSFPEKAALPAVNSKTLPGRHDWRKRGNGGVSGGLIGGGPVAGGSVGSTGGSTAGAGPSRSTGGPTVAGPSIPPITSNVSSPRHFLSNESPSTTIDRASMIVNTSSPGTPGTTAPGTPTAMLTSSSPREKRRHTGDSSQNGQQHFHQQHKSRMILKRQGEGCVEDEGEGEGVRSTSSVNATIGSQTASGSSAPVTPAQDLEFTLPTFDKLVSEIQTVYFEISRLEAKCAQGIKNMENTLEISSNDPENFDSQAWWDLYQSQARLVEKYFDFMFLAYHPSGNNVTRGLVRKYRMPIRLWNKGIFNFLDLLRYKIPYSMDLITKFTYHTFFHLTMLVEPPYDTRNMWIEALGDIARFSMALEPSDTADWRRISQYWYGRATAMTPGVGRLYHHYAIVCTYKLDSLFYFCKR